MTSDLPDISLLLPQYLGKTLRGIHRVVFEYQDTIDDWEQGMIEFVFEDDSILRVFDANGGDRLDAVVTSWSDPFQGVEPDIFVKEHGKWTKVEVSTQAPFEKLIGHTFDKFVLFNQFGNVAGVVLTFGTRHITIYATADECHVRYGDAQRTLEQLQFTMR